MSEILWWAYIHTNGSLQIKRYFSQEDITEACASPFVTRLVGPFKAKDRADAEDIAKNQLKEI